MAVSILDAVSSGTGSPTTYTVSSGSNRFLVALIHFREADGVQSDPALTWGGQSMTETAIIRVGSGVDHCIALFTLNESGIAAGSGTTVSLTWDNTPPVISYGIISIQGANQTITDSNTNSSISSTEIDLTLTAANGGIAIGGYTLNDNFNGSFTWQNSFTEQYDLNNSNQNCTMGTFLTTGSSVTVDANNAGTIFQSVMAAITFSAASGSVGRLIRDDLYT